ncbi:MAG: AIPR family protein [Pirellulaceae bacterium]
MSTNSKSVVLSIKDNDLVKRLKDPYLDHLHHLEAILPFTEAAKLDPGNANVRPAAPKKPAYKAMRETVESEPQSFHVRNRGITYFCERFQFDNSKGILTVTVPVTEGDPDDFDNDRKYGIGDGGHTFAVIQDTIRRSAELLASNSEWQEPFVRVHFIGGYKNSDIPIEQVVEALNTSAQVKQVSLDEYANKFDELKRALTDSGFDTLNVAFRENEEKEWTVEEIIQRMACFLKERWTETHPASMYKSKSKALELYTSDTTREEFAKLYPVIKDVITLPEYIQSVLSDGETVQRNSFSRLRAVKLLPKKWTRPGTKFVTEHKLDLGAVLPMAGAFRELLRAKGSVYEWRFSPHEVFKNCAPSLYAVLKTRMQKVKNASQLGADMEYWGSCAMIVMREKDRLIEES